EVKRSIANGSVGFPHVRVGQCQAVFLASSLMRRGFFICNNFIYFPAFVDVTKQFFTLVNHPI
ncbi:MAG: hypothetical protein RLZZ422_1375, partial [Pseudomonadota bacterium]